MEPQQQQQTPRRREHISSPGTSYKPAYPNRISNILEGAVFVFIGLPVLAGIFYLFAPPLYTTLARAAGYFTSFVGGGGAPPNTPTYVSDERAAVGLFVFLLALYLFLILLVRLPLKPTWVSHTLAARRLKPSPFAFVLFVGLANSPLVNTTLGQLFLNERVWTSSMVFVLGNAYLLIWSFRCPQQIRVASGVEVYHYKRLLTAHPGSRYLLSILMLIVIINMAFLVYTLMPSAFAERPDGWSWWCLLWPPACS